MSFETATIDDLRARYPEFKDAPDERVSYWLADSFETVSQNFDEMTGPKAQIALACSRLHDELHCASGKEPTKTNRYYQEYQQLRGRSGNRTMPFLAGSY